MFVTCATSHLDISASKEVAPLNIPCMLVTDETSHLAMSALKAILSKNSRCMSVTRETSHSPIGPWSPMAQLPSDEIPRHLPIAWSRAHFPSGENSCVFVDVLFVVELITHTDVDTDPGDRSNILLLNSLTVSDSTQCTPQRVRAKAFASPNMNAISITCATFHLEMSTLKDSALRNMLLMFVTCATFQLEMSVLKKVASLNIPCILVTDETSHFEISALKCVSP